MQRRTILKSLPLFVCPPTALAFDNQKPAVQEKPTKGDRTIPPAILSPSPGEVTGSTVPIFGTYGTCTSGLSIIVRGPNNEIIQVDSVPYATGGYWYTEITITDPNGHYTITVYCNGSAIASHTISGLSYEATRTFGDDSDPPEGDKGAVSIKKSPRRIKKKANDHQIMLKIVDAKKLPQINVSAFRVSGEEPPFRLGHKTLDKNLNLEIPLDLKTSTDSKAKPGDYVLILISCLTITDGRVGVYTSSRVYQLK